ncbi:MAG: lysoplasmalogenase [Caulobacter sp.]|nr:lysoplasmalogenase [Caulobacter sp.]
MTEALWGASALAALTYGLALVGRPPSAPRTVVKTIAVALLAVLAVLQGAPWLLVAGLALCAAGDAFLAGDPKRWLPFGLVAFLLGHTLYIFLFTELRDPALEPGPLRLAGLVAVAVAAVAILAFLWKALGALRPAVILYVIAIAVMTGSSLLLDGRYWPAMVGSVAFMASDAILAISLFREEKLFGSPRATDWSVWFLYYGAQVGIAWPFISGPF